jgi:putative flippase GtrA
MAQSRTRKIRETVSVFLQRRVIRFLIVGALSFAIDLGLLMALHEVAGVELWIATPVAFITSLIFNFLLQRRYTFQATNKSHVSAVKYGVLVVFNIFATDLIVLFFAGTDLTYATGKVVSTISTMVWNFFIYKYWIFPSAKPAEPAPALSGPPAAADPEFENEADRLR